MKSHYQAVVIGGGIVGASVLYHLTKFGWKDVAMLERKQLTAGSTWHAAAGFHSLNGDVNMARLQSYTINLYKEVQEISGQDVGLHVTGGLLVASSDDRWTFVKSVNAMNKTMGIDSELITPEEVATKTPLIDTTTLRGGLWDPHEGHLDPYGATYAFVKSARMAGADLHVQTMVEELVQKPDGSWQIVTNKSTIHADHVINAAGLWAREVGHMAGVDLPLMPFEHHYIITENIPELENFGQEACTIADTDGEIYVRQEQMGALFGVYEKGALPWAVNGTSWDYGETDLLPSRLDDLTDTLMKGFERFPSIAKAGIKRIVNGPFTFTPDGNPLVGPVPGVRNYWSACGVMAGFSQCGGIGLTLAQWMIEGEPEGDVFGMDVARYGKYATQSYVKDTGKQFYETRMNVPFPNEVYPAGRPNKTTPIYDLQKQQNAVFGAMFGLEVPLWFAREGEVAEDIPTFQRGNNSFESVRREACNARKNVGLLDTSSFSKYEITGPGAEDWLNTLLATRIPGVGRACLAVMLSHKGQVLGDLTLVRFAQDRFWLTGSGALQEWHMRWFNDNLPDQGVSLENVTDHYGGLALVGPRSREVLQQLTHADLSNEAFPFLAVGEMNVGFAPTRVVRISVTGELGYEVYMPVSQMRAVYESMVAAGEPASMTPLGVRALLSMRLEKGFGIWGREFSPDYSPNMNSMGGLIRYEKGEFNGREAIIAGKDAVPDQKLVVMEISADNADALGYEPVLLNGEKVGYVTSGGYGFTLEKSLAMAYIDVASIDAEAQFEVPVLGDPCAARVLPEAPYDPQGLKMRA